MFERSSGLDHGAPEEASAADLDLNDVARVLAGLSGGDDRTQSRESGRLALLSNHARRMDELFRHFRSTFADPFSRWVGTNFDGMPRSRTVFYPMSGPDIAFPLLLHSQADTFVLCGLEPCGSVVDPSGLEDRQLSLVLDRLRHALGHFLTHSYFVTADMRTELVDELAPGVLPLLLMLLARSDCSVLAATRGPLRLGGEEGDASPESLHLSFSHRGRRKRLLYVRQDLRDAHFSRGNALFGLVAQLDRPTVFLKSASYLLHEPYFSTIRGLVLEHAATIVQDPSSLPFRALRDGGWKIDLHGRYSGTLPIFGKYEQPDLVEAYRDGPGQELDFGFSYLKRPEIASLMIATPQPDAAMFVRAPPSRAGADGVGAAS